MTFTLSRALTAAIAASLTVCGVPAVSQTPSYEFADKVSLDRRIDSVRADWGASAVAVAAGSSETIYYARGFGLADKQTGMPVTADTPFALASATKPITALAIMMLVDDGKIDLDRSINDYLGEDKVQATFGSEGAITVARVMEHTAGLPFYYDLVYADEGKPMGFSEMMRRHGFTVLPPGVTSRYSNLGYEILAEIVARQSGTSYADFVRQRIFNPLDLQSAAIALRPNAPAGAAERLMLNGERASGVDTSHRGAASAYMSAHDLVRLGQFWLQAYRGDSRLLSQSSARYMATNSAGELLGSGAGHGFFMEDHRGAMNVHHGGSMIGTKVKFAILPELDLVYVVMVNRSGSAGEYAELFIGDELLRSFAPEHMFYHAAPRSPQALNGTWQGVIGDGDGAFVEIWMDLTSERNPRAYLGGREVPVRSISGNGPFNLTLEAELPQPFGNQDGDELQLELVEHKGKLVGNVRLPARTTDGREKGGFSYWTRLERSAQNSVEE